jgi:peptidoglycan/LPS O-acetylase OafA/YrhL
MKNIYLPGLNGIRAIACLMVFYDHFYNTLAPGYSMSSHGFINLGEYGVTCFFTLSGFLITTLLLREKETTGAIHFKSFYMRRILRIWPLYFLIILIGSCYFVVSHLPTEKPSYFLFYIFFIGNLAFTLNKGIWIINPLWSVGVEEQFYAFWPLLINSKKVFRSILVFLAIFLSIKVFAWRFNQTLYYFMQYTRIDCMCIGGILAFLNYKKFPLLRIAFGVIPQLVCWAVFALSFIWRFHLITLFDDDFYSVIVGIIILNVSYNPRPVLIPENRIFNYIGKISYGMYAYNYPILFIWGFFIPREKVMAIPFLPYTLPWVLLSVNILVAHISYFCFEKRFLQIKLRYSFIKNPVIT